MDTSSDRSMIMLCVGTIGRADFFFGRVAQFTGVVQSATAEMPIRELCKFTSKQFVFRERLWKSVDVQDLPVPTICHDRRQGIVR